jgi:hypothetical protein
MVSDPETFLNHENPDLVESHSSKDYHPHFHDELRNFLCRGSLVLRAGETVADFRRR